MENIDFEMWPKGFNALMRPFFMCISIKAFCKSVDEWKHFSIHTLRDVTYGGHMTMVHYNWTKEIEFFLNAIKVNQNYITLAETAIEMIHCFQLASNVFLNK